MATHRTVSEQEQSRSNTAPGIRTGRARLHAVLVAVALLVEGVMIWQGTTSVGDPDPTVAQARSATQLSPAGWSQSLREPLESRLKQASDPRLSDLCNSQKNVVGGPKPRRLLRRLQCLSTLCATISGRPNTAARSQEIGLSRPNTGCARQI